MPRPSETAFGHERVTGREHEGGRESFSRAKTLPTPFPISALPIQLCVPIARVSLPVRPT
jgi:hypothetical protein